MIEKLRRRMIGISVLSFVAVFTALLLLFYLIGIRQMTETLDMLTGYIMDNAGTLPSPHERKSPRTREENLSADEKGTFTVRFDRSGQRLESDLPEDVLDLAEDALDREKPRGWVKNYRFRSENTSDGHIVVLANSRRMRVSTTILLAAVAFVLTISLVIITLLIILLSRLAVHPLAESYRKQRQFVTDANHELKTPLTLILTNLDILESQLGQNEWLDDIRTEGQRMTQLVNKLTALSRLDEKELVPRRERFSLSDAAADTAAEFLPLAQRAELAFSAEIQPDISILGDEGEIRQIIAILLDNAVKYCDPAGSIRLSLCGGHRAVLTVENTCREVDRLELPRLFDRFYRADPARTAGTSFGIGLSLAQAMTARHGGTISAYKAGPDRIGFRLSLK